MEFWSRLIRGGTPQKQASANYNNPQYRLAQFKHAYNNLLQIWRNGDCDTDDAFVAENARICLHRLAELLNADQRGPTPHRCVSFAATSRLLATAARVSAAFGSDGVTHEALELCGLLVDSEEEAFLEDRGFADALPDLIESARRSLGRVGGDLGAESATVEVLFGVAAKLRVEPRALRVWFRPERPEEDEEELSDSERRTRYEEFPLFYMLLHSVPAEGRAGEFARMGLLYIIESTAHSQDLEKWIVEGDMAALMASGLGALYSQLSRKLAMSYIEEETPLILTFSDRLRVEAPADAEKTTSIDFQSHLATFLASLVFWQDLLEHCASVDVKQTLLDHFRYLFLQQLLYPSLLESSDIDGGSSVAVLTYLRHILESIDHPDLVGLTLRYLFGMHKETDDEDLPQTPMYIARRRKSDGLLARLASEEEQPSPDLFNLSDLIMASLRSKSQQTVTATLHILSAMLRRPHHQSFTTLLRTRHAQPSDELRTVGGQEKEVDELLSIAESPTAFQDLEISYEQHLQDNRSNIESHPCTIQLLSLPVSTKMSSIGDVDQPPPSPRILHLEDPTFKALLGLLSAFFTNDIETNLGLTQVFIDLASCGHLRLEGWLLSTPSAYTYPHPPASSPAKTTTAAENAQRLFAIALSRRHPIIPSSSTSPLLRVLTRLSQTVNSFRRTIPDFDAHLLSCRTTIDPDPAEQPEPTSESASEPAPPHTPPPHLRASPSSSRSPYHRAATPTPLRSEQPGTPVATPAKALPAHSRPESASEAPAPSAARGRLLSETSPVVESSSAPRGGWTAVPPAALLRRIRIVGGEDGAEAREIRSNVGAESEGERAVESEDESGEDGGNDSSEESDDDEAADGRVVRSATRGLNDANAHSDEEFTKEDVDADHAKAKRRKKLSKVAGVPAETGADVESDANARSTQSAAAVGTSRDVVGGDGAGGGSISLGQLLTNVVVLQEFALELAAAVEVRAGLFGEVRYFQDGGGAEGR